MGSDWLDPDPPKPILERCRSELMPVVRMNVGRRATLKQRRIERFQNIVGPHLDADGYTQGFACVCETPDAFRTALARSADPVLRQTSATEFRLSPA